MRAHKKATRSWNPLWLKAYAKGDDSATATMVSLKSQKPVENDDLEAIVGGIEKTSKLSEAPLESSRIMRFNEWVLLNQVHNFLNKQKYIIVCENFLTWSLKGHCCERLVQQSRRFLHHPGRGVSRRADLSLDGRELAP